MPAIPAPYERSIRGEGERNIAKIADNFCWALFALVVITPAEGGLFAIIDG
ncbi:hypothetical protein SAMN05216360_104148 [Methylobacterium phyllostachyos]|uniref:Uncharacterized protein n=1 Tax=Methylobacterium phyllostachyos TaxID=582672 RepID=A0A1G9WW37_9HYPH|nr:hypothetical protein [Methylobacterium phyllostachyos]SDM88649.1 hypothetical protein SAMN05216360_104148 [Methylobacterium phyllostachyos]